MKRITLRSIPENAKKALYHDLDHLAGLWSREEAAVFDKSLKTQRKVDAELWKKSRSADYR